MTNESYLEKIDRLNRQKGELQHLKWKEDQAARNIQNWILLQRELQDQIEILENEVRQIRYSEQPKKFFHRMMGR